MQIHHDRGSDTAEANTEPRGKALGFQHTFAEALEGLYLAWTPAGFAAPKLVELNRGLLEDLGLPELSDDEVAALFSGSVLPADARPLAQAYAGHQFGGFVPTLGDGRALLLGELIDQRGRRVDVHLKGSGPTPFSRGGDGKATLGPVLREYLVGEAMHQLGVPTTRILAAILTGESVLRERPLPGAVLARTAASHLRVGTLEFLAARRDYQGLERLVHYALERHYPERMGAENPAHELCLAVAEAQGLLIAHWTLLGFVHGVMNTDNTTLSGETIDYGPCAFMEAYDPNTVFSSIDRHGRYAFGNQPAIGRWNLSRLGQALAPLLAPEPESAIEHIRLALDRYEESFGRAMELGMQKKLGLSGEHAQDQALVVDLLNFMQRTEQDYTLTFRRLAEGLERGKPAFADEAFVNFHTRYLERLNGEEPAEVALRMNQVNPLYIARNHRVEEALAQAVLGNLSPFRELLSVLENPYTEQRGRERYAEPAPADFGPYQTFCGT